MNTQIDQKMLLENMTRKVNSTPVTDINRSQPQRKCSFRLDMINKLSPSAQTSTNVETSCPKNERI